MLPAVTNIEKELSRERSNTESTGKCTAEHLAFVEKGRRPCGTLLSRTGYRAPAVPSRGRNDLEKYGLLPGTDHGATAIVLDDPKTSLRYLDR